LAGANAGIGFALAGACQKVTGKTCVERNLFRLLKTE
jgi:hypothetical protein